MLIRFSNILWKNLMEIFVSILVFSFPQTNFNLCNCVLYTIVANVVDVNKKK